MEKIVSSIEVLSTDEVVLIHNSSAKLLEETGIHVPNQEILQICEKMGAKVDYQKEILRIPRQLLEEVLEEVKKASKDLVEEECKKQTIKGFISTQVFYNDYMTGISRYGLREDNYKGIALLEKLESFPKADALVVPSDVPSAISDVISYCDIYTYSKKPGSTYILTPLSAKYILELNKVMGFENHYFLETISPLSYKRDTLDMALYFAKNGGSIGVGPMAMGGATAPVTIAGALTLENAEIIGSIFIAYAISGKPAQYSAPMHSIDMKTMLCSFGGANQALYGVAVAQMAKYYGLLGSSNAGLTDSLLPDFQGGVEKGITACFNFLAGCRGMGAQGIVGADQGNCLEQLVIDNEWIKYYNYIVKGFEVSEDTIGLDALQEVGCCGNFLGHDHTLDYWRDNYLQSDIFYRNNYTNWVNESRHELLDRAHQFVEEAIKDYKNMEPVVSSSKKEEMDRIVADAIKEAEME